MRSATLRAIVAMVLITAVAVLGSVCALYMATD